MRKYTSIFFVFAAFFFAALTVTLAYNRTPKSPTVETVHPVSLLDSHADPAELIIRTGETVRLDNNDGIDHSIQEKADDVGASATVWSVPPGGSARLEFKNAGTFNYFDKLHPSIVLKVIVYDPSK